MAEKRFKIIDVGGIHARPAMTLVKLSSKFVSDVQLEYKESTINLKSIMGVMSLGIPYGSEIMIKANGPDEEKVILAIVEAVEKIGLAEIA